MRIERVDLFPVRLPLARPFVTAAGGIESRELAVLQLTDSDGHVGLGEITPYPAPGATGLDEFVRAFALEVMPRLDGCDLDDTSKQMEHFAKRVQAPLYAAIDTALLDLQAHGAGVRFAELLGEPVKPSVAVNATVASVDADQVAEDGKAARIGGFTTIKLKVGLPEDKWRVAALRNAVGYDTRIRLDANGAWYSGEAVELLGELTEHGIELIEQPVKADDLIGMHKVREGLVVPVVADEGVRTLEDLEKHIATGACDGVAIKLSQVGGPTRAGALADRAKAAGLFSIVTSTLDGPVGLAASLHFAAAREEIDLACGLATADIFAATYATGLPEITGGSMQLAPRYGLGLSLDEAALAEYAIDFS
ncbi:MAG: mandelate racemase/muconate lactonizing enzyme family protein [Solirubrobacterales bacterium]